MMTKIKQAIHIVLFLTTLFLVENACYAEDITAVYAGTGLSGGGATGEITLNVTVPLSLSTGNFKYNTFRGYHTGSKAGVYGENTPSGNFGYLGDRNYGVKGHGSGNSTGGYFSSDSGYGLIVEKGNVGIGTRKPERILDVNGLIRLGPGDGPNAGLWLTDRSAVEEWYIGKTNIAGTNQVGFYKDGWRMVIADNGNVGIGTKNPERKLDVAGTIRAEEIIVETGWADHVLNGDYPLMPLSEVAQYIGQQGHLPGIPSADDVAGRGVKLGEMQVSLLEKVEEMTLHLIAQEKEMQRLRNRIAQLEGAVQ